MTQHYLPTPHQQEWDDRPFYARHHASLSAKLETLLHAEPELQAAVPFLREIVKVAVPLVKGKPERYALLGNTRVGGMPDLPVGRAYPCFEAIGDAGPRSFAYEFIAQVDLASVAAHQSFLPRSGRLYFFLSTAHDLHGDVVLDYPVCLVEYVDQHQALCSGAELHFQSGDYFDMVDGAYAAEAFGSADAPVLSAPSFYAIHQNERLFEGVLRSLAYDPAHFFEDADEVFEVIDETFDSELNIEHHYLGGYGQSLHEFPVSQAARARGGQPADWQLLLTVRSCGTMHWGDEGGDLQFAIHKGDLARGDFSRIWVGLFEG